MDMSNYNSNNAAPMTWSSNDGEWPAINAVEDDDYFDSLYDGFGVRCQACYGSGLDRDEDADCMTCWGEGFVYRTV